MEWHDVKHLQYFMEMDENLFFHLANLTILKAIIIHGSCGSILAHKGFWKWLIEGLIQLAEDNNQNPLTLKLWSAVTESSLSLTLTSNTEITGLQIHYCEYCYTGAHGSIVGWGTTLQARWS
jgi:hypothetical protein